MEFEADVELVWTNAMAFNEDGSQVYEDAKVLKVSTLLPNSLAKPQGSFEKILKDKKELIPDPPEVTSPLVKVIANLFSSQHLKLKLNLQHQLQPPPPPQQSTKIKLHMPQQQQNNNTPPTSSPPILKKESPILPPKTTPQIRQGSPLKNQITASP